MNITVARYIKEQKKALDGFQKHWEKQEKENPKSYPAELSRSEWDEQLTSHFFLIEDAKENGEIYPPQ